MRRVALGLAWALWAFGAHAQVSGSASIVSDYRFRGISLTGDRPAVQATLVYDNSSGAYAGAFASSVRLSDQGGSMLQLMGFAGYAARLGGGPDLDVGIGGSAFPSGHAYDYAEVHAGVAFPGVSARMSYAPHYFGQASAAWYFESNGSYALGGPFNAFGHAGVLRRENSGYYERSAVPTIVDASAGVSAVFDAWSATLEWTGISTVAYAYPVAGAKRRNAVVFSITRRF